MFKRRLLIIGIMGIIAAAVTVLAIAIGKKRGRKRTRR